MRRIIKKVDQFNLELTNTCNMNCSFCANRFMTRKKGMMDLSLAKRLVKEVKDTHFCDAVGTNVMGEPLLYPHLGELLRYAREVGQKMIVLTNGNNLDEGTARRLLELRPYEIGISYHASDEESFAFRHSSLNYTEYREKIYKLIDLKFLLKARTRIVINVISTFKESCDDFIILNSNEKLRLFADDWIDFANTIRKRYRIVWNMPHELKCYETMLLPGVFINIMNGYHSWGNKVIPPGASVAPSSTCSCLQVFNRFNVLWNGDATICCLDYDGEMVYDNIIDKSILEVFNSDKINKIRKGYLINNEFHKKCAYCFGRVLRPDGVTCIVKKDNLLEQSFLDFFYKCSHIFVRESLKGSLFKYFWQFFINKTKIGRRFEVNKWRKYCKDV